MVALTKLILSVLVIVFLAGCRQDEGPGCPLGWDLIPPSPYEDPVWHPGGELIGFNHIPLKHVTYTYGRNCPLQASYRYEMDSAGFWLVSKGGANKRRVLPFFILCPAWSPDGKWIAFSKGSQIFKMAFDGNEFDQSSTVQLTTEGQNFCPAWSSDGQLIAYENNNCGVSGTPIPPNSCGVLIMAADGSNKTFIGEGREPYWGHDPRFLYAVGYRYDLATGERAVYFDLVATNILIQRPLFNPVANEVAFIGHYTNIPEQHSRLFAIRSDGSNLTQIGTDRIMSFSWSPDGEIVYLNYDYSWVDETKGTLWIMKPDGTNQKQLTFNHFTTQ